MEGRFIFQFVCGLFSNFFQLEILSSQYETVAQVFLADNLVFSQFFRGSLEERIFSFKQQVGTVGDAQGFLHVMVCNQIRSFLSFSFQTMCWMSSTAEWVYSGKRFVEHDKFG